MKKVTLIAIKDALTGYGYMDSEVLSELNREITRGEDAKAKNAEAYEAIHELVVSNLAETPCTCGELYEAIASELPTDMTRSKVQYALNHLWQDEIVKIAGKPNTYRRA